MSAAATSLVQPLTAPLTLGGALPAALCAHWCAAAAAETRVATPLAMLAGLRSADVLRAVAASALRVPIESTLGPAPLCNLSQSWLRHGRPPHQWHQDGALRLDFMAHAGQPLPADALLQMLTCWIALTPCGENAPGLEWVAAPIAHLLLPAALTDAAVWSHYGPSRFVRPRLQPGDALLFDGALLHRTHLTAQMTLARSSLELRFFRNQPLSARLAGDTFEALA